MNLNAKIYIACHTTLSGSAILRSLQSRGYSNLLTTDINLLDQAAVNEFFTDNKPEYVFLPSYKSGSIKANIAAPAEFIYENLAVQTNIIHAAHEVKTKKLLYLGASCVYPAAAKQPTPEEEFLTGPLEKTSEAYAVAKIAGIEMCESYNKQYKTNFISAIPATIYGPGDKFDPDKSHVLTGMIKKFHEAKLAGQKEITLWGSGQPIREFIYSEDFADACIFLMPISPLAPLPPLLNIGTGEGITIKSLAEMIKSVVGYSGEIKWNTSAPDGALKKVLDSSKIHALGWQPKTSLESGIKMTYQWFLQNFNQIPA